MPKSYSAAHAWSPRPSGTPAWTTPPLMWWAMVRLTVLRRLRRPPLGAHGIDDHGVLSAALRAPSLDEHDTVCLQRARALALLVLAACVCGAAALPVDAQASGGNAATTQAARVW